MKLFIILQNVSTIKKINMKKISILFLLAIMAFTACNDSTKQAPNQTEITTDSVKSEIVIDSLLKFNESTLPYENGILVANFGSSEFNPLNTEGKGYILYYKDGSLSPFIEGQGELSAPKGMFQRDGYLYVADVNKVVVFNLKNKAEKPIVIKFPKDELFVNDIAVDGNNMYVSVTNTGNIYQFDLSDVAKLPKATPSLYLNVTGANGLLINDGKMYIASYPADGKTTDKNLVYVVEDMAKPVATPFITKAGQYDGLALSADKKTMYTTNWGPIELDAINMDTKEISKVELQTPLAGVADISVVDDLIYIPDLAGSKLIIKSLK